MSNVFVLHENPEWVHPLRAALSTANVPHRFWDISEGEIDLHEPPPHGVFYARISASAHTRGHGGTHAYGAALVDWLESYGRRVVNGSRAVGLELNKGRQYSALRAAGVRIPATRIAVGEEAILAAGEAVGFPLIVKPNRGGKGLGVAKVDSAEALRRLVNVPSFDPGPDGTTVVQRYVVPAESFIIRNEFVGGRFHYAVRVDTSGGFEVCPADACEIEDLACPVGESPPARFQILEDHEPPDRVAYEALLREHGVEIAGIEYVVDKAGDAYTYDINVNTNYNQAAEERAGLEGTGRAGMNAVAAFLEAELARTGEPR